MPNLILPRSVYQQAERKPTAEFVRKLEDIDSSLVVYWNRFKGRWVIDRCVRGNECAHVGNCERMNAMIVQTPDGQYMDLCERVLTELRGRDMWRHWKSADEMGEVLDARDDKKKAKQLTDFRSDLRSSMLEDRAQLNRARQLIQTHSLKLNK